VETFRIGRYPVTNLQIQAFVRETTYRPAGPWVLFYEDPLHPATGLAKQDVDEYCAWAACRLARGDEGEVAARGPDALLWPGGGTRGASRGNWQEGGIGHRTPVDYFAVASPLGLCDSSGNVWEMTSSPFAVSGGVRTDAMKGGAFSTLLGCCRSSFRIGADS